MPRVVVGGVSGEPRVDVVVRERGGWSVYSEGTPRKRLGGPYASEGLARKRLAQIEWFKAHHDAAARQKRLPRQIPPTRHEEDYTRALVRIVRRMRAAWAPVIRALPDLVAGAAAARGDRMDAGETSKLKRLVSAAADHMSKAIRTDEIEATARKFAQRTGNYQKVQLANQVRAALGVDPVFKDRGLAARVDQFTHENVALVSSIPERLHGELEALVTRAVSSGQLSGGRGKSPHTLRAEIVQRFDVSESRAKVIARDQIGKFYAGVNHARQKEMGVNRFVWRTVGDERVRGAPGGKYSDADPSHYDLDGEEFDYDDPPNAGPDGETCLPGEAIQCRCWAEPVFGDDEDEQDSDQESDDD